MSLHLLAIAVWVIGVSLSMEQDMDACALVDEPMFCTCDTYGHDTAHRVSCSVSGEIKERDLVWKGFLVQRNVQELSLRSRNGELKFIPTRIIKGLKHLRIFVMKDGLLHSIQSNAFVNMNHLNSINLDRNNIEVLQTYSFSNMSNLEVLTLNENSIKKVKAETFYRLPKLEKLYLDHNNLSIIDDLAFVELPNLKELDLSYNQLHYLSTRTFVGLRSLRRLILSKNHLNTLADGVFSGATGLEELDLWSNSITYLNLHALDGLNHLRILNLSQNRLVHLHTTIFKGTPSLEVLNLIMNRLETFQEELVYPLSIEEKNFTVYLRGNHLNCSCDLLWLTRLSDTARNHLFRKELRRLKCRESETSHLKVSELTAQQFSCPEPPTTTTTTSQTAAPVSPESTNVEASVDVKNVKESAEIYLAENIHLSVTTHRPDASNQNLNRESKSVDGPREKPKVQYLKENSAFSAKMSILLVLAAVILAI